MPCWQTCLIVTEAMLRSSNLCPSSYLKLPCTVLKLRLDYDTYLRSVPTDSTCFYGRFRLDNSLMLQSWMHKRCLWSTCCNSLMSPTSMWESLSFLKKHIFTMTDPVRVRRSSSSLSKEIYKARYSSFFIKSYWQPFSFRNVLRRRFWECIS